MLVIKLKDAIPIITEKPLYRVANESGFTRNIFRSSRTWPSVDKFIQFCNALNVDCKLMIKVMCKPNDDFVYSSFKSNISNELVCKRMKGHIVASGLSSRDLSKLTGFCRPTLSRINRGAPVKLFMLDCICDSLNVELASLFE